MVLSGDSSTTKTGRRDIAEILLKVALKHQKSIKSFNTQLVYIVMGTLQSHDPNQQQANNKQSIEKTRNEISNYPTTYLTVIVYCSDLNKIYIISLFIYYIYIISPFIYYKFLNCRSWHQGFVTVYSNDLYKIYTNGKKKLGILKINIYFSMTGYLIFY